MAEHYKILISVDPTGSVQIQDRRGAEPAVVLSLHEARELLAQALVEVRAALGEGE